MVRTRKRKGDASPIRRVRILRDLTQEQVAERAKLSHQQVGHLERNERKTKLHQLKQLAQGMDVLPSDLIGERDEISVPVEYLVGLGGGKAMPAAGPALAAPFQRLPPPPGLPRTIECFAASVLDDSADRLPYPAGSTLYVRRAAALKHRFRYGDRVLVAHRTAERGRREFHEILAGVIQATAGGDVLVLTRSNNRQVPPALVVNEARRQGDAPAAEADLIILPSPDAADRVVVLGRVEMATIPG